MRLSFQEYTQVVSVSSLLCRTMAYLIYTAAHIAFSKKKIVGQIFCSDWGKISEKISEQLKNIYLHKAFRGKVLQER